MEAFEVLVTAHTIVSPDFLLYSLLKTPFILDEPSTAAVDSMNLVI